ncbi:MAG: helix-turn-helix transcriptional regulator [Opitutales bacterium]
MADPLQRGFKVWEGILRDMALAHNHADIEANLIFPGRAGRYLAGRFRARFGMPPFAYIRRLRLAHAAQLLLKTDWTVTRVALDSGFATLAAFYTAFRKETIRTPGTVRRTVPRTQSPVARPSS